MSGWNYRVLRETHYVTIEGEVTTETTYAIHEVYYDASGKVNGWTETPVGPVAHDVDTLRLMLAQMMIGTFKDIHNVGD